MREIKTPADLLDMLGLEYRRKTNRLEMLCVFHPDRNPSAAFYEDSNIYYCFSCQAKASMEGFYARYRGVTLEEAKRQMNPEKKNGVDREIEKLWMRWLRVSREYKGKDRDELEEEVEKYIVLAGEEEKEALRLLIDRVKKEVG